VPDLMVYDAARFNAYCLATPDWQEKPFILVPNLAVEVVSPSDRLSEIYRKAGLYLEDGVQIVWVIDFKRKTVGVFTPTGDIQTLHSGDILSGGAILPQFTIAVSELFG